MRITGHHHRHLYGQDQLPLNYIRSRHCLFHVHFYSFFSFDQVTDSVDAPPPLAPPYPRPKQCSRKTYSVTTYAASTAPPGASKPGLPFPESRGFYSLPHTAFPPGRTPCGKPGEALARPGRPRGNPPAIAVPCGPCAPRPPAGSGPGLLIEFQAERAPGACDVRPGSARSIRAPACDRPPNALAQLRPAPQAPARSAPDRGIGEAGSGRRPWSAVAPRGFVHPPTPGHRPDPASPQTCPSGVLNVHTLPDRAGLGVHPGLRTQDSAPELLVT